MSSTGTGTSVTDSSSKKFIPSPMYFRVHLISTFVMMAAMIIFLVTLFYYLSIDFNYDSNGVVIKDDNYNRAQTVRIISIVFCVIMIVSFIITYFY
jgi:hypothetical protein